MKKVFNSESYNQTKEIGKKIAGFLKPFDCIAFRGGMGMGKTCLISGIAEGLGFMGEVSSPTFAIVNEYRGGRLDLFHFDMYRVTGWEDLLTTGFFDYSEEGGVLAVEWSENIENALPENTITVTIEKLKENSRVITVEGNI